VGIVGSADAGLEGVVSEVVVSAPAAVSVAAEVLTVLVAAASEAEAFVAGSPTKLVR